MLLALVFYLQHNTIDSHTIGGILLVATTSSTTRAISTRLTCVTTNNKTMMIKEGSSPGCRCCWQLLHLVSYHSRKILLAPVAPLKILACVNFLPNSHLQFSFVSTCIAPLLTVETTQAIHSLCFSIADALLSLSRPFWVVTLLARNLSAYFLCVGARLPRFWQCRRWHSWRENLYTSIYISIRYSRLNKSKN